MMKRIATIVVECLFDLGITIVYATLVGLVVGAIALADGGVAALLSALVYAALLPLGFLLLIFVDALCRMVSEGRGGRSSKGAGRLSGVNGRV